LLEALELPGQDAQHTLTVIAVLGDLCEAWDAADPGKGHDIRAREWRQRLADMGAAPAQPPAQPAPAADDDEASPD
jgi:hypothetical protein